MALKVSLTVDQVLKGCEIVISEVSKRRVSEKYQNEEDVKKYPFQVRAMVTKDVQGINLGQVFTLKLAKSSGLEAGQTFDFTDDGATVTSGSVSFWSRKGFVQVSLKGDELIAR